MITFNVQMPMDLSDWKDHVLGSGAWTYGSWWVDYVESGDDGIHATWYTDIDRNEATEGRYLSYQQIADAASDLAAEGYEIVSRGIFEDDFDAIAMDCVLQKAYIGEIRYG